MKTSRGRKPLQPPGHDRRCGDGDLCFDTASLRIATVKAVVLASFYIVASVLPSIAQADQASTLEQRQPLELVFADSIVPQDDHEMMLTTGAWYSRRRSVHDGQLTQKVEWGISEKLQISGFANPLHLVNSEGTSVTGAGDFSLGARYTWVNVNSPFTHVALAMEAGFPSGNPLNGLGDGAYGLSPSILVSHEFKLGRYQAFSTVGLDFVVARRRLESALDTPRNEFFANNGFSARVGPGWTVGELSVATNRWSGGDETHVSLTPSYVWRLARRTELLFGVPLGVTPSTDKVSAVVKFTFELGGQEAK